MRKLSIDPKLTKTYKTVENMEKAIAKLQEKLQLPDSLTYLECEVDGRFTAVFTNVTRNDNGMYLAYIAQAGFKIVG
jgi:fructose-1,6-bisphosphatase